MPKPDQEVLLRHLASQGLASTGQPFLKRLSMQNVETTQRAIKRAQADALFMPTEIAEPIVARVKPNFSTACWSFTPPHRIYVGLDIVAHGLKSGRLLSHITDFDPYIEKFFHHERAHALYTRRDDGSVDGFLAELNLQLEQAGLSFGGLNLFEDARIEERYRKENSYQFGWLAYEKLTPGTSPDALFFAAIQSENNRQVFDQAVTPAMSHRSSEVWDFYQRCILSSSAVSLISVLHDWVDRFGAPPASSVRDNLLTSHELANAPGALSAFEDDGPGRESQESGSGVPTLNDSIRDLKYEGAGLDVIQDGQSRETLDEQEVAKIVQALDRATGQSLRNMATSSPTRRLNVRAMATGKAPFRKKELVRSRKRRVALFVDCSGSMEGTPIETARLLVAALSDLTSKGKVNGHVIFSAILSNHPSWASYQLPMPREAIERIAAIGEGEGLAYALKCNQGLAADADLTMVLTDGFLSDAPINKSALRKIGVQPIGLYTRNAILSDEDQDAVRTKLMMYFDKAILADSALEAAHLIVKVA